MNSHLEAYNFFFIEVKNIFFRKKLYATRNYLDVHAKIFSLI
jgi:hypothetical protein